MKITGQIKGFKNFYLAIGTSDDVFLGESVLIASDYNYLETKRLFTDFYCELDSPKFASYVGLARIVPEGIERFLEWISKKDNVLDFNPSKELEKLFGDFLKVKNINKIILLDELAK